MEDKEGIALVDVDGVINSWAPSLRARRVNETEEDWSLRVSDIPVIDAEPIDTLHPLYLVRGIRERLATLDERFECVWATAWEEDAPLLLSRFLGVGREWPVVAFPNSKLLQVVKLNGTTWKLPLVSKWVERNGVDRPVTWIDDDLEADAYAWSRSRVAPTLLLQTDMFDGFTDRDLDDVMAWCDDLRRAA